MRISAFALAFVGILAPACTPDKSVDSNHAALTASADARAFGVEQYVVSADTVSVLGKGGAELGVLRVSAPSAEKRLVEMTMTDLGDYQNEITRPTSGMFNAPIDGDTREVAVQTDPALASFFAAHAIALTKIVPTSEALVTGTLANCADVTWTVGCIQCGDASPYACYVTSFTGGTIAHAYARCSPVNCGASKDLTAKNRTCYDAGGCTQQALGFQGCVVGDCYPEE